MTTVAIRQKLQDYLSIADDKKIKAIYALVEDEIEQDAFTYTEAFKAELDKRYAYYKEGGKMVSVTEAKKQIKKVLSQSKK
jgi:hypothetical protein